MAQLTLAWILRRNKVTSALIGASRISQLEENVATINNLDFSDEQLNAIEKILK